MKDANMPKLDVKAGRKLLDELGKESQEELWNHLKEKKYIKRYEFADLAGCTGQSAQRLMKGLVRYGILESQSTHWRTTDKWRDKWAHERANQDPEEDQVEPEESVPEEVILPPSPKPPTKQESDPPKGLKEESVAEMIRKNAEQEGEEEPIVQKPSPARKKGSNPKKKTRRKT